MFKVVPLHKTDTVFTCDSTLHLDSTLHHPVDDALCLLLLLVVEQDDRWVMSDTI
jgi:hypothetical protein